MNDSPRQDREGRAVDALIAAALRQGEFNDPTDEELLQFLADVPPVSPAGKAALNALGPNVIQRMLQPGPQRPHRSPAAQAQENYSPLYAAMNRKNASNEFDAHTEGELERKRKEALDRIKKRKKQGGK